MTQKDSPSSAGTPLGAWLGKALEEAKRPERIGPYRLLGQLGEGGMGEVWEAEQQEPVRRRVALKLIKWGMDTKEIVARFESERQALALMDHPAIARVFDAGSTPEGRPFFVMELVRGVRITDYCDQHGLDTEQRLELFIQVCEAVQHAHHKGIIHRDLKPSNILVSDVDHRPQPKVIDFGISKATSQRLTERTLYTGIGRLIGTPEYMSPEQADLSVEDVDTRTDVYSLGAVLYELLVGEPVIPRHELRQVGLDELRRRILEQRPERPSTRASASGGSSTSTDRGLVTERAALARRLRGDLDWIVMKALEKERARRYDSAAELAADVERHLRHEPVLAGPPGFAYHAAKFVRRHTIAVTAGLVAVASLLVAVLGLGLGLVRARSAEQRASAEAETARQVSRFMVELFRVSDPNDARGNSITAREILDRGAERITGEFADRPLIRAHLLETMGSVYRELGLYEQAERLLSQAAEAFAGEVEGATAEEAVALQSLAALYQEQGRWEDAGRHLERALALREAAFGAEHPLVAKTLVDIGTLHQRRGQYERALPLVERSLAIREAALAPDDPDLARSLHNLSILYRQLGRYDEAEAPARRALEINRRALGEGHPAVAGSLHNLARIAKTRGELDEARTLYRRALAIKEKTVGPQHPSYALTLEGLAILDSLQGRHPAAARLYRQVLDIREQALGEDHYTLSASLHNLALSLGEQGELDEAIAMLERALALQRRTMGSEHPHVGGTLHALGNLHHRRGDPVRAEENLRQALAVREASQGPDHPDTAKTAGTLAALYIEQGRAAEGERLYARAFAVYQKRLPPDHPDRAALAESYASLLRALGRADEAEAVEAAGRNGAELETAPAPASP